MNLTRMIDLLRYRLYWLKYGVPIFRSADLRAKKIKIGGNTIRLKLPPEEEKAMDGEFRSIFYDDCYGLEKLNGNIKTVLDVGSNVGFFCLAARSRFPTARIHSYEPNPQVQKYLLHNTNSLGIEVHAEAIGARDGLVDMNMKRGSSLFAETVAADSGAIKRIALTTAIERLGGSVDLLKLDCEGMEWELFEDKKVWSKVGSLSMEYHLWAKPHSHVPGMIQMLRDLGFRITYLNEAPELEWGILHAAKHPVKP